MTIREYVVKILQEPLKKYRTPVQDAILELMIEYFENHHILIDKLPTLLEPNKERYDILNAIAESYQFNIRPEAMIEEQLGILSNIAYVYKLRGSVYSIEHMKELYGGNLPSPVHIDIPSYDIFRYNISAYDQTDVYEDGIHYRPGIYDIHIYRYFEDIDALVDWMYKELIASGATVDIINHLNDGENVTTSEDNTINVSDSIQELYEDHLYMSVIDEFGRVVALKSVDEFRYIRNLPTDYAIRILKYRNSDDTGIIYYIDLDDDTVSVEYGFSSSDNIEPESYIMISSSTIVDPTNVYLWVRINKAGSIKSAVVDLKDEGENWYIQYALVNGTTYDWLEWTDHDVYTPGSVVFTSDPSIAIGLYLKTNLVKDEYPLCKYNTFKLYKNPTNDGNIMRSSYYSDSGEDEYGYIGDEVASITFTYDVVRSKYMTDSLVMILKESAQEV